MINVQQPQWGSKHAWGRRVLAAASVGNVALFAGGGAGGALVCREEGGQES